MKDQKIEIRISSSQKELLKIVAADKTLSAYILDLVCLDLAKRGKLCDFLSI